MTTITYITRYKLTTDPRYRQALVRLLVDGEAISADPFDGDAARFVQDRIDALAAAYEIDTDTVIEFLAGSLWGAENAESCISCGWDHYSPTCPSCQIDAGVTLG